MPKTASSIVWTVVTCWDLGCVKEHGGSGLVRADHLPGFVRIL